MRQCVNADISIVLNWLRKKGGEESPIEKSLSRTVRSPNDTKSRITTTNYNYNDSVAHFSVLPHVHMYLYQAFNIIPSQSVNKFVPLSLFFLNEYKCYKMLRIPFVKF